MKLLDYGFYERKTGNYNLITINCEWINREISDKLKSEFADYFHTHSKKLGGKINCLNLEKVIKHNSSILSDLWVFKTLNKNFNYPTAILCGCQDELKNLIKSTHPYAFDFVNNKEEL